MCIILVNRCSIHGEPWEVEMKKDQNNSSAEVKQLRKNKITRLRIWSFAIIFLLVGILWLAQGATLPALIFLAVMASPLFLGAYIVPIAVAYDSTQEDVPMQVETSQ
jgi:archaellum biogenesis protein FlaJ (TadC family)